MTETAQKSSLDVHSQKDAASRTGLHQSRLSIGGSSV
jgi:hypothetical protein